MRRRDFLKAALAGTLAAAIGAPDDVRVYIEDGYEGDRWVEVAIYLGEALV